VNSSGHLQLAELGELKYLTRPGESRPQNRSPPLLCFLHGYDEAAPLDIETGLTRHGPFKPGNPAPQLDQFVCVAPQLPRRGDIWHRYAHGVREIVLHEAQRHDCDPRRLYLTGFSFGGNGVFDLALVLPAFWAALWPVDPTRVPAKDPEAPVCLHLGEVSRYQARSFIRKLQLVAAGHHGEAITGDRVWFDEGHDHVQTATAAYRDARIYEWLLRYPA
jgi:predicted peptidase